MDGMYNIVNDPEIFILETKKYLSNHPEYEGKTLYFENRSLVERSEQDVAEQLEQRETSWASNNLSYAATWALWQFASKKRILQNLQAVFGKELGTNLLALAIYQLLDGGAMNGYEDWLPDNWLPVSAPLSSQRISELLAQVHMGKIKSIHKTTRPLDIPES